MVDPARIFRQSRDLAVDEFSRGRLALRFLERSGVVDDLALGGLLALLRGRGRISPSMTIRFHAANTPNRGALVDLRTGRTMSYAEFDLAIDKTVSVLKRIGIRRGQPVVLMMKNCAEFLLLQMAVSRLGAAAVAVSYRSTAIELAYLLDNSGARALFFSAGCETVVRDCIAKARHELGSNAIAVGGRVAGFVEFDELIETAQPSRAFESESGEASVVIYTSGTTGKPKGAVRKFDRRSTAPILGFLTETPLRVGQRHLVVCPLYHSTAFGFVGLSFVLGNTVHLLEFEPEAFLRSIERHRIHHTAVVPTQLHRTLELGLSTIRARDTSSLLAIFSGGAPLSGALASRVMDAFGDKLFNFYGATETGLVTLAKPHDLRVSPGTIGPELPGNHVRLLDERGMDVAPGEVGELFVKSGNLVHGYHRNPTATDDATRDGYFSVGDLARRDSRGNLFIEGRKRDMIISGGVNVYPREVEAVLAEHRAVGDAAVIGLPDEEWGERVHAFVEPRAGEALEVDELVAFCKQRLAGPKRPRAFTVLPALPRNPTGKILKRELRRRAIEEGGVS